MFLARVVGEVVSTHKNEHIKGKKLLIVRRLDLDGGPEDVTEVIAIDVVGAGVGEKVLVVQEGSSARTVLKDPEVPVQAVIVGVVDSVNVGERGAGSGEQW